MNSFSSRSVPADHFVFGEVHHDAGGRDQSNRLQFILGIVVCCMGLAIFFAPEKPQQFASICEKYNTANACQIW